MTRAIRNAMAVSATVLALSMPSAVLAAGNCSHDAYAKTHLCSADLVRADAAAGAMAPVDLTLVADESLPSSVYAADAMFGMGVASEPASFEPLVSAATFAEQVEDLAWIDGAGESFGADTRGGRFSFAGDISASAFLFTSNDTDISVSGNPAIGLDLADDATDLSNTAWISADASDSVYNAYSTGVRSRAGMYDSVIANTGTISADAYSAGFLSYAVGVFNHAPNGDARLSNDGLIEATAYGNEWVFGFGVYNIASVYYGESSLDNNGQIHGGAHAVGGADFQRTWSAGVRVSSGYASPYSYAPAGFDDARLTNNGSIDSIATIDGSGGNAVAWGAHVQSLNPYGTAQLENNGSITATAWATSVGGAYATFADAIGAYSASKAGSASITNYGDVHATAGVDGFGYARAIAARAGYLSSYAEQASILNTALIEASAHAHAGYASAIGASTGELNGSGLIQIYNAYGATITAEADVDAYGIAKTIGISGRSNTGAYVVNQGDVSAYSQAYNGVTSYDGSHASALGVLATSPEAGEARVVNLGYVDATAVANGPYANAMASATGIRVDAYDVAAIDNTLAIDAYASGTSGAYAYGAMTSSQRLSYLNNAAYGSIVATSDSQSGYSVAAGAFAMGRESTTLTNYGDITAQATTDYGNAQAYAAIVYGGYIGIGLLINGGDLQATATAGDGGSASATGAYATANVATIFNDAISSATATAGVGGTAVARGANAYGMYSAVSNYGQLTARADATDGTAVARGSDVFGYYGATAYNAGDISAVATAAGGVAQVTGSYSIGMAFSAYSTNNGTIMARAEGDQAEAMGVLNGSAYIGNAVTVNDGDITAIAVGGLADYGEAEAIAFGVYNFAQYYDSVVDNRGSIFASTTATTYIDPTEGFLQSKAIGAMALNGYGVGDTIVTNSGEIGASALASVGYAVAWGAVAQSPGAYYGIAQVDNHGLISSYAHVDVGMATASGAYTLSLYGTSDIVNHGDVVATAVAERGITDVALDFAVVYGTRARSFYGNATTTNYGNIEAHSSLVGGIAYSYGVVASGYYADVHNAAGATITATVETELFGGAFVNGVTAGGLFGVNIANEGSITAYASASGYATGELGFYGASGATGIAAAGSFSGDAYVINTGSVTAISLAHDAPSMHEGGASAVGIDAYGDAVALVNQGAVTSIAQAEYGIAGTSGMNAHGKYSNDITNAAGASIYSYASAGRKAGDEAPAAAIAFGTQTWGSDYATTYNAGTIIARAVTVPDETGAPGDFAAAYGSTVGRYSGIMSSELINLGDIEATAHGDFGYATTYGAYARGRNEATISNTGNIRSAAISASGNAFAVGSHVYSLNASKTYNCDDYGCDWDNPIITIEAGQALIDNSGDIVASANAVGGVGYTYGAATFGAFVAGITNAGHITAVTEADEAMATGALINSFYGDASLVNGGEIVASAAGIVSADAAGAILTGDIGAAENGYLAAVLDNAGLIAAIAEGGSASATGASVAGLYDHGIVVSNGGTIQASASGGAASAYALSMQSGGDSLLTNTNSITARAQSDYAYAVGTLINGYYGASTLANTGVIAAAAYGYMGSAMGAMVTGGEGVDVNNQHRIVAIAEGDYASATGLSAIGDAGGASVTNTGTITAAAYGSYGYALAVQMDSTGVNQLTNTGTIAALGDGWRVAIASGSTASAQLLNQGTVAGAIRTGGLDDSFENAQGATWLAFGESVFGDGNDDIVNHGTVVMDDSVILMGSGMTAAAADFGPLAHNGTDAFDNFGTVAVSGTYNLIEGNVYNNGVITFVDGVADDVLTIVGDFAGDGAINIDVSGLNEATDQLYVDGSVIDTTTQTINVNMLDTPDAPEFEQVILTAGAPLTGDWELGNVNYVPNGFVMMDFNLTKADNTLVLGMEVTGLTDAGSLAASIAPGVHSLVNAQVGNWRQRMGFVPQTSEAGLSPWIRAFSESGDIEAAHSGNFGTGGDFAFHQSNRGWEVGVNILPAEGFAVGLLMADAEGTQSVSGAGSDRFDAKTLGVYATWMTGNGFYLDVSHRSSDIDARLRTADGNYEAEAEAKATNIEAGFTAWKTASGFNVVPQLQYTRTVIDSIDTLSDGSSEFVNNNGTSSRARLGVAVDRTFQGGNFAWTPYGSINAVHEFDGQYEHTVNDSLMGRNSLEGTSAMIELGVGARRGKLSFSGGLQWTDGGAMQSVFGAQAAMRYNW